MNVCLAVGGSDSCAGAGIQADLSTFQAFGVHGCSAITALTAQNPQKISSIMPTDLKHFRAELIAVFDYYDVRVVKTGMLMSRGHIEVLLGVLQHYHQAKPLIVDPVLVASSGKRLLDEDGLQALQLLCREASLVTPNGPEMVVLNQTSENTHLNIAVAMASKWQADVLLKGGHMPSTLIEDVLISERGMLQYFKHARLEMEKARAHGTGCRLASAIAAKVAKGFPVAIAVKEAVGWLHNELLEFSIHGYIPVILQDAGFRA